MHTSVKISNDKTRAIMLRSFHQRNTKRSKAPQQTKRSESVYGTKSYRDAVQRAFNKAKERIYFNPDMNLFITLTYKGADQTLEQVQRDIQLLIRNERRLRRSSPVGNGREESSKYLYVMEYQKRGSIHVHMIANNFFTLQVNRNKYRELALWQKGFSSVLTISDFDNNFRPHLYLFKYMRKAQRIGKTFVHSSKNLDNYTLMDDEILHIPDWDTKNQEYTTATIETTNFTYLKNYLLYNPDRDTITSSTIKESTQWQPKTKAQLQSHLNKMLEKHQANRTQP